MPHMSIKDVPVQWAEALRARAARNHRSLQGELMAILEQAVQDDIRPTTAGDPMASPGSTSRIVGHGAGGEPIIRQGWMTVEQVVAALKAKYPEPFVDGPLGVDIIREDRDSR